MTTTAFKRIGIFAKPKKHSLKDTTLALIKFIESRKQHSIVLETETAETLNNLENMKNLEKKIFGKYCDLVIVIGGDGSLLNIGRAVVEHNVPILGINCGKLGFIADINPQQMSSHLEKILNGEYIEDDRCILHVDIIRDGKIIFSNKAINDVVLYNGDMARLMEFDIFIDNQFVMTQNSDGIITATPTGSTAYSLSAGGPILYPTLHAFSLISLYPHTLTNRPIVIKDTSSIRYVIPNKKNVPHKIACDGQIHTSLLPNDEIHIKKHSSKLKVIHPKDHNHFNLLRNKLGWNTYVGTNEIRNCT